MRTCKHPVRPVTADTLRPARRPLSLARAAIAIASLGGTALAQDSGAPDVAQLQSQIEQLKQEQAERDLRISVLEDALYRLLDSQPPATPQAPTQPPAYASRTAPAPASTPAQEPRLKISGDLRVRLQGDYSDDLAVNRHSSQVRARLGATYAVSDRVRIGARIVTGDSGDPNSTDVQLSNFNDDLEVSLDQAYVQLDFDRLQLYGGKFPQPFVRTDLVWDSDVMPQGVAATWRQPLAGGGAFRANGMFFVVDEQAAGSDSTMKGLQLGYETPALGSWKFDATAGYYDYRLGSIAGADAGDFRSNLRAPDGTYLSDFDLVNVIAGVSHAGFSPSWPLRLTLDYVRNRGAETDADTGYGADLSIGKASDVGDWRFTYGYSAVETDAVFAAFSHDNIGIATNYKLHALTLDYVPSPRTLLTGIWYHYRPFRAIDAGPRDTSDWLDRFRLAFLVNF